MINEIIIRLQHNHRSVTQSPKPCEHYLFNSKVYP